MVMMTKVGDGRQSGKTTMLSKAISCDIMSGKYVGVLTPNLEVFRYIKNNVDEYIGGLTEHTQICHINSSYDLMGRKFDSIYADELELIKDSKLIEDVERLCELRNIYFAYS